MFQSIYCVRKLYIKDAMISLIIDVEFDSYKKSKAYTYITMETKNLWFHGEL